MLESENIVLVLLIIHLRQSTCHSLPILKTTEVFFTVYCSFSGMVLEREQVFCMGHFRQNHLLNNLANLVSNDRASPDGFKSFVNWKFHFTVLTHSKFTIFKNISIRGWFVCPWLFFSKEKAQSRIGKDWQIVNNLRLECIFLMSFEWQFGYFLTLFMYLLGFFHLIQASTNLDSVLFCQVWISETILLLQTPLLG